MPLSFADIADDLAFLDDWDERYGYIIDLGKRLDPLTEEERTERTRVRGCASQVWLVTDWSGGTLAVRGDSDAAIVRGLVAIVLSLFSGLTREEAAALDAEAKLAEIDLKDHVTAQRANGLVSMIGRLKAEAAGSSGD